MITNSSGNFAMYRTWLSLALSVLCVASVQSQDDGGFTGRVIAADGTPIEGAVVTLPDSRGGAPIGESSTDAGGRFAMSIATDRAGMIHRRSQPLRVEAEGYSATYLDDRELTVFPNMTKDLGDIALDVGRVYTGRIVTDAGRPISEANIICGAYRHARGTFMELIGEQMSVVTDDDGRFTTPQLPLGIPYIGVQADGYLLGRYEPEQFPNAGREGRMPDLVLRPDVPIHGVVVDNRGAPVKNAEVQLGGMTAVTTGDSGTFVLRGLAEDVSFQILVHAEDYAFLNLSVTRNSDGFEFYDMAKKVAAKNDARDPATYQKALRELTKISPELRIVMHRESRITGRVVDADTGDPITVSRIVLCEFTRKSDGEIVLNGCRTANFEQSRPGEFSIGYWLPTEYHLAISAKGYNDAEAFTPPITSLRQVDGIVVKMHREDESSNATSDLAQRLEGTIKERDQVPDGARAALWSLPEESMGRNVHILRGRTTPGNGKVHASTVVENGHFSLNVPYQSNDWYVLAETPDRVVSLHGPLSLARGEAKSIELSARAPGSVSGSVPNHAEVTVPLYAILFSDIGIQYETRLAQDGSFEFADVYPGTYGLKIGSDSILDEEVRPIPESSTREERLEITRSPSTPWKRARRIDVEEGQSSAGIEINFEP